MTAVTAGRVEFPQLPDWYDDWYAETADDAPRRTVTSAGSRARHFGNCRWCGHKEHGFKCADCKCDSTWGCRDDSWRPHPLYTRMGEAGRLMHDHGVDGYVAYRATVPVVAEDARLGRHILRWIRMDCS